MYAYIVYSIVSLSFCNTKIFDIKDAKVVTIFNMIAVPCFVYQVRETSYKVLIKYCGFF